MACRGSAVRIRLAPLQEKKQLPTGFLAACKSRFFNAEKAKYHFLCAKVCAKSLVSRMAAAVSSGISCELTLPSRGCFLSRLHGHI